mgnify:CR=1 FL=1
MTHCASLSGPDVCALSDCLMQPRRKVCISIDDSVNSQHALEWLQGALLRDGDEVHIAVVALPVPYPVSSVYCCCNCSCSCTDI